jgi:hypothetical protein
VPPPSGPVRLTVHAGPTRPVPLPGKLTALLRSAQVTETDTERSVFTLSFDASGRDPAAADDVPSLRSGPLTCGSRVSLVLSFGAASTVLADGFVTEADLALPDHPGGPAMLNVTAEDPSFLLDLEERDVPYPNQSDYGQVVDILRRYADRGITAQVSQPDADSQESASQRLPSQHDTDLRHLVMLARRHDFACYMIPGPDPGTSACYWGRPVRAGQPQPAVSVDLGSDTNVEGPLSFRTSALAQIQVQGAVKEPRSGGTAPFSALTTRREPLAALPLSALRTAMPRTRRERLSGPDSAAARGRAQARLDRSIDGVTGTGTLDGARYRAVLRPRALVGVRGAGWAHDGLWYVKQVVHDLTPGSYRQSFTITREGFGSTVQTVRVVPA